MAARTKVKIIRWSDPPSKSSSLPTTHQHKRQGWDKLLARLAERPGEWALIRTSVKRVTITQKFTNKKFRDYEFVSRKYYVGDKAKYGVWGRYSPNTKQDIVKEQFIDLTMADDDV